MNLSLLLLAALMVAVGVSARSNTTFLADMKSIAEPWDHNWEVCVGSCHALTALRADWQSHMKAAHDAIGFKYVRFHGLFDDDMSVLQNDGSFGWFNVDTVMDFLVSIGMRPFVELSFMPERMARTNCTQTIFHYKGNVCPPQDLNQWARLVSAFARHMISRYGIFEVSQWFFEVWNEPNIDFWAGNQADYFALLSTSFQALKSVDSRLRVGGPATAQSAWLADTVKWVASQGFKLDFISTHEYPSDPNSTPNRDNMKTIFTNARSQVGDLPLYYSEFNSGLDEAHHDDPFAAAFLVKTALDAQGVVDVISYWSFSDIFEEGGQNPLPFSQQFGIQNIHGIPKPVWRAFEFLRATGTTKQPIKQLGVQNPTVDVVVSRNDTHLNIIASNYNWVKQPISTQVVDVTVLDFPIEKQPKAVLRQLGPNIADPRAAWIRLGSPAYPSADQIGLMRELSNVMETPNYPYSIWKADSSITFTLTLEPFAVLSLAVPL